MHSQQKVIVVTGGPGGGKTTALDLFQRELKAAVKIVPEAATMLFGHGLDRQVGHGDGKLLQRSIYRMQISLEQIFRDVYANRLLICDRGTLDGLAYWPDDEQSYLDSIGTNFEAEVGPVWRRHLLPDCGDPWRRREKQQPVPHRGFSDCRRPR